MSKLSENQSLAVAALAKLLADTGCRYASAAQWRGAEDRVFNVQALVNAGAVEAVKVKDRSGDKVSEVYRPVPEADPAAE